MLGTIVNTITITLGALVGSVVKKGIKPQYQDAMYTAMGLAACAIGMNGVATHMSQSQYPVLFIISLALGSLLGTILDLNGRFQGLVNQRSKSNLGQGLSTGILMYCIGTLSILGPVMAAVNQDYTYLFTNATLDFVTSMVLASTYGVGMVLAAPVLFCWQGSIWFVAKFLSATFFSEILLCELSVVGGILIFSSGLGILGIKDCKTLNMLPSLFVPILFFLLKGFFGL
ncbi:MAG: DUF554 domain-containing protein [Oscillospiraceae bacterium]|nr:DUF554 domain-containing protein [Oscillospiraceae bacterium]